MPTSCAKILIPGGVEAGQVAIPFRIFHSAKPLAVLDHGRPAARIPGGLRRFIGLHEIATEEFAQLLEVRAIGGDRVLREPVLQPQGVAEGF